MSPESAPLLEGITVIDFTRVLAGPYCTLVLADRMFASERTPHLSIWF